MRWANRTSQGRRANEYGCGRNKRNGLQGRSIVSMTGGVLGFVKIET